MPQTLPDAVSSALEYEDFYSSFITEPVLASDTDIHVDQMPISTNSFLVIDPEGATPEIIYFTSVGGDYVRCPSAVNGQGRGVFNTDPQDWAQDTVIGMFSIAAFFEAIVTGKAMRGSFFLPVGAMAPYAGPTAPSGWLICDGSSVLQANYADLFALIGTTYGPSDATHFTLPDMRGRMALGVGARTWALSFLATAVTTATDQITITANNNVVTGKAVVLTTSSAAPAGLTAGSTYYVIVVDSTHIKLATSLANAVNGTAIDITTQGSGTHTLTFTGTSHSLAETGGEDTHALTTNELPDLSIETQSHAGGAATRLDLVGTGNTAYDTGYARFTGGKAAHNILNPYLGLNYIIKT